MKKIAICLMMAIMSLTFLPFQLNAAVSEPTSIVGNKANEVC